MSAKTEMDMLHGPLKKKILLFALPIAATSILQQLFNAVDIAVVGRFVGSVALAAVGTNAPIIALFVNGIVNLSIGATVSITHLIGLGKRERIQDVIHSVMFFAVFAGLLLAFIGVGIAKPLLTALNTPDTVLDEAVLYLRIYFLGLPFIAAYNFLSAIIRSVGDSRRPLLVLLSSGLLNVVLNLTLVLGLHRGVDGVAIATVISNIFSAGVMWILMMREEGELKLHPHLLHWDWSIMKKVFAIGGPASLQSMFFCLSNICIQSAINSLGATIVAAAAATQNYLNISFYMVTGFNQAIIAFTGQNYGAGQYDRCRKVMKIGWGECVLVILCMVAVFILGRYPLLSLFTSDGEVLKHAATYMMITEIPYFLVVSYENIGAYLRAINHSLCPAIVAVLCTVVLRILYIYLVFSHFKTFAGLMMVYPISWIICVLLMFSAFLYFDGQERKKWKS